MSSSGKVLPKPSRITFLNSSKIVPMQGAASTISTFLNSSKALTFFENYNKDIDFENEKIMLMDNIVQSYSDSDDVMITSALGLNAGMSMKGAIPFKNFSTTFSTMKFLKGFYNSREGDIYAKSNFTIRGNHSHAAARFANY
ncbi:hypothetical protein TL16_g09862 [Triparma laevis f. inornata]|uniref:Uncharacterized protein n=1 Tax=Triparma laevis f. inornata TaxID=1714386 RepID=A0A9W7ENZ1_9STRA|nr:hypothetical protein TL16_g09862 [Triparma laevis f. inornata]